ncbi:MULTISPECIES: isoprenylcysteine carboxylmethyltransferase family protein [unclassified Mesorhizobium]|uniref:methyltransferase family protein n=1 Tax=unclassified Mesorhizobium TaxID=325217 RepID=UPI000FCB7E8D|nr:MULTISPECIES: isoprenylcysteine carboxylmethyltransferase family protein [unclassified Mesorhizobium]TGP26979.1 isoprenylcysteine carboxylmethyltransferase family protein [Mesorhizobium sp. M1D.F.Ca.ET.231.01.1.1]TGP38937.1 isoprenylcysteine carboxylmethyltransferase family protein [Mesorhizobium sp. M1D.F.Ca.ET.234.01.1.1]TGS51144.1 isoprenylcysteine carboxylmethyltransferase family protein [Mesorhizobium sp. M1D.F.Ca.ET.184.01.1.1]TGS67029.1 isoprenylcysteine carboxylmethyltransferase fami
MAFIWFIYAAWLLLIVYLTVQAIGVKRDTEPHLLQSFGLMFAMIAAFLLPRLPLFAFVNFAPVNPVLSSISAVLAVAGMALLVWARQTLGRNWSQTVSAKQDHELVTSGPYRLLRHPMYTGGLLACIGSAIVVGGPFVFLLVLLGAIFIWRVGAEDRLLARQFPDEFPDYARRTNALIPFVW